MDYKSDTKVIILFELSILQHGKVLVFLIQYKHVFKLFFVLLQHENRHHISIARND